MNHPDDKLSIRSQSTVAVDATMVGYGSADTVVAPVRLPAPPTSTRKLKFLVGELTGLLFIIASTLYIFALPVSLSRPGGLRIAMNRLIKRTLDILGATVGLVVSAPVMALAALAIKLDSPGPIFYTQVRVGVNRRRRDRRFCQEVGAANRRRRDRRRVDYHGRPFKVVKFRSMVHDAEKNTGPVWATKDDPRITRLGRFLRKSRLDEVPQFWSVLKGDMSLVGPRPERPAFVQDFCSKVENYHRRLDVKPGITGLAQVENGYDSSVASVAEKVRSDLRYIRGWSIWSDVRILLRTVVVVFTGKGAC